MNCSPDRSNLMNQLGANLRNGADDRPRLPGLEKGSRYLLLPLRAETEGWFSVEFISQHRRRGTSIIRSCAAGDSNPLDFARTQDFSMYSVASGVLQAVSP